MGEGAVTRPTCPGCNGPMHGSEGVAYSCILGQLALCREELERTRSDAAIGKRVREAREQADALPMTTGGIVHDRRTAGRK